MRRSNISDATIKSLQEKFKKSKHLYHRVKSSSMPKHVKDAQKARVDVAEKDLKDAVRSRSRRENIRGAYKFIAPAAAIPAVMAVNKYGPELAGKATKYTLKRGAKDLRKQYGAPVMSVGTISGLAYLKNTRGD